MLLFSAIAWNGLRLRGERLNGELRIRGTHYAVRLTIIAAWLVLMTLATSLFGVRPYVAQWLFFGLVVPLAIARLIMRNRLRAIADS
jgi:hypothetical protein